MFIQTVAKIVVLFVLSFSMYAQAEGLICSQLFMKEAFLQKKFYTKFNPEDPDSTVEHLKKHSHEFSRINPSKTNLKFLEDTVEQYIDVLSRGRITIVKISNKEKRDEILSIIDNMGAEAFLRMAQEKMNYYWIWGFAIRMTMLKQVIDGYKANPSTLNLDDLGTLQVLLRLDRERLTMSDKNFLKAVLKNGEISFGHMLFKTSEGVYIFPTSANLDFKHFVGMEGTNFFLAGTPLELWWADGILRKKYADFLNHDLIHIKQMLEEIGEAGPRWKSIHLLIADRINRLEGEEWRYTVFAYFYYVLHESRSNNRKAIVYYMSQPYRQDDYVKFKSLLLLSQLQTQYYFKENFEDVPNKEEIIRIGADNLSRILHDIKYGNP